MGLSHIGLLIAVLASGLGGHVRTASRGRVCPSTGIVREVRATRLTCSEALSAVKTYKGSPTGCVSSSRCIQSGLAGKRPIIVDCTHSQLRVDCLVYVKSRHGSVHDPKLGGRRVPGRYDRGSVHFELRGRSEPGLAGQ